jgi:hypothetical protein
VRPLGQPRTQGNFINRAFDVAVKTATVRMKEEGLIRLTCKPTWTKKVYGCFNVSCSCKGHAFRRLCLLFGVVPNKRKVPSSCGTIRPSHCCAAVCETWHDGQADHRHVW